MNGKGNNVSDLKFFESSLDSVSAAMGVMTQSANNICKFCQKVADYKQHECLGIDNIIACDEEKVHSTPKIKWTKKQWLILLTSLLGNFGCAVCVSLQAPFFPAEAARKHVTPSVYGFVFSAFSLTVFILAPLFGKYIAEMGPRFMMNSGIFVTAFCCILFGFLDKMNTTPKFISFAFLIRIIEAVGDAGYHTANFATMAASFPGDIGKIFALLRASFGIGLIVGPTIGGLLYQIGGYSLPFAFMGGILLLLAVLSTVLFWNENDDDMLSKHPTPSITKALAIPSVALSMCGVCLGAQSIGFLSATLEPHLRQFSLDALQVGLVFVISGGVYAFTSVFWGWLCDGKVPPKIIVAMGAFLLSCMCILIGPAPFVPYDSSLELCILALVFHGLGLGAEMLASHVDAVTQAMHNGFPQSYQTYGMVSGLWAACFQLGNFLGPFMGGILYDNIGFRLATMVVLGLQLLLMLANLAYYFLVERNAKSQALTTTDTKPTTSETSSTSTTEKTPLIS